MYTRGLFTNTLVLIFNSKILFFLNLPLAQNTTYIYTLKGTVCAKIKCVQKVQVC